MKICVITATYPLQSFGGIFVKEQCEQLAWNGNDVCVLYCSGKMKAVNDFKIHFAESNGVSVLYNCFPRCATTLAPRFWCWYITKQLNILYKRMVKMFGKPDVIYAHFSFPAGKAAKKKKKKENIPVVVAEHWSGLVNGKAKGSVLSVIKSSLNAANSIICVSPALRDAVNSIIGSDEKITVIPNMLSNRFTYHQRVQKDNFVFFSLGTLHEKKNFELLIHAFVKAFKSDDNVSLRIGGAGPDEEKIKQLIENSQRTEQIKMLGKLNRDQTVSEYTLCDSFILLSPKETFGIAYREAMAVGRPIISLENGGIRYNWDDKNGIIVDYPSNDVLEGVVSAMKKMVAGIDQYNLEAISESTLSTFSAEQVSKRIEKVLLDA